MKFPEVYELSPSDVRQALCEWLTKHKHPNQPLRVVRITVMSYTDGSATVVLDSPEKAGLTGEEVKALRDKG